MFIFIQKKNLPILLQQVFFSLIEKTLYFMQDYLFQFQEHYRFIYRHFRIYYIIRMQSHTKYLSYLIYVLLIVNSVDKALGVCVRESCTFSLLIRQYRSLEEVICSILFSGLTFTHLICYVA